MLNYLLIFSAVVFLLCFPFIPVGGPYYRGLLLIWHKYPLRSGGFFDLTPKISWFEMIRWADPFSFRFLKDQLAVDKNFVYAGQRLDHVDRKTLRFLEDGFWADKNHVRLGIAPIKKRKSHGAPLEYFDPESFQYIGANFVKDKSGVYYMTPDEHSNPENNKYQRYGFSVDVFRRAEIVDAETFRHVEERLFSDKNFLYKTNTYGNISSKKGMSLSTNSSGAETLEILQSLGTEFFQDLGCFFYLTHKGVYWSDKEIKQADRASFEIFCPGRKNDCKFNFYAKDKNNVYFQNIIAEDADPATFRVTGANGQTGEDKNFKYSWGRKL
jgi:hypothetical protein